MSNKHDWSVTRSEDEEDDDPVDAAIRKTGCLELHYNVMECMAEHHDWRKCKNPVAEFKTCIDNYNKSRAQAS